MQPQNWKPTNEDLVYFECRVEEMDYESRFRWWFQRINMFTMKLLL